MLMRGRLGGFSVGRYWCGGDKPPQSARKNGVGETLRRCRQPLTEQHASQSRSSTSHTPQQKDTVHRELRPGKGRGPALAQDCCTTPHGLVRTSPVPRSRRRPPRSRRPTRHVPRQQQQGRKKGGHPFVSNRPRCSCCYLLQFCPSHLFLKDVAFAIRPH